MNRWRWFQLVSFQVYWFAAVLGGNRWLPFLLLLLILHFLLSPSRRTDLRVISLALVGVIVDGGLTLLGVFEFNQPPIWLAALWIEFVLSIGHSLVYLRRLKIYWLPAIGACAGSYAYLISWNLGAVELPLGPLYSGLIIASVWAVMLPLLVKTDLWIREDLWTLK